MPPPFRNLRVGSDRLSDLSSILADLESSERAETLFNWSADDELEQAIHLIEGSGTPSPFREDAVLPDPRREGGLVQQTEEAFSRMQRAILDVLEHSEDFPISLRGSGSS